MSDYLTMDNLNLYTEISESVIKSLNKNNNSK